ncbi:MAG: F0F1 ATP synthase subunit gamma [Deltaproteobacteria bacterium]|nr:F0F1 ATP synthase subunit gamma [Deltaproteobacteria bacterium]TLN01815.1 MAG: F0F1 ATP synthase subunit gamma [bacterium]
MPTLENLKTQIGTIDLLQSVVRTMKTLAAVSIRQQEKAIQTLSDYSRTIDMGLAILLNQGAGEIVEQQPVSDGKLGAVIIGSDQGLCGRFNEQVVSFALEMLRDQEPEESRRHTICVGSRAHMYLAESGARVDGVISAPVSVTGIIPAVNSILVTIEQWHTHLGIERVVICSNRLLAGTTCRPEILHLLPLDRDRLRELVSRPWPGTTIPFYTMDRNRLFSLLVRQSLFASLYRVLAESMAGENASRLASMQAAEKNIGERLGELNLRFRDLRQGAITEELLDIVAGFEAMTSEGQK